MVAKSTFLTMTSCCAFSAKAASPLCCHDAKLSHTTPFVYRDRCNIRPEPRKKPRTIPGLLISRRETLSRSYSVIDRTAERIIDPRHKQVDVRSGVGGDRSHSRSQCRRHERRSIAPSPQVVVLQTDRPVRRKAEFDARSDSAAPTGPL